MSEMVERIGAAVIKAVENVAYLDDSMREIIGRAAIEAMRFPAAEGLAVNTNSVSRVGGVSEMVERVAVALSQSFKDTIVAGRDMTFEETKVELPDVEIWRRYARAAIEKMREPTEKMVKIEELPYSPGEMTAYWHAMIDESLK